MEARFISMTKGKLGRRRELAESGCNKGRIVTGGL